MFYFILQSDDTRIADKSLYLPLLFMGFYLKDNLSKQGLQHHLQILKCSSVCSTSSELQSAHTLLSKYSKFKHEIKKTFICPRKSCSAETIARNGVLNERQPCGHFYKRGKDNLCYILYPPIRMQLEFFARRVLHSINLKSPCPESYISDVETGSQYQDLKSKKLIDDQTLTLQLNIDGAVCFKFSKFGFWPFMGIFNEAPYRLRRSNILLLALWFGNKKPPADSFIGKVMDELQILECTGFMLDEKLIKLKMLLISTDTVARPIIRGTVQFNGKFGCDFCLHPGNSQKKITHKLRPYSSISSKVK